VVWTFDEVGMNAEDPRTVCVEVDDAFLRNTFLRSGERGGGSGRGAMMDDRDDLVGDEDCREVRDCDDAKGNGLGGIRSVS
jgi:hypothetical protein